MHLTLVKRDMFFRATQQYFPHLFAFVRLRYSASATLFFGGQEIESAVEVLQGDPLAPLVFCLTSQTIVDVLPTKKKYLILGSKYLDKYCRFPVDQLCSSERALGYHGAPNLALSIARSHQTQRLLRTNLTRFLIISLWILGFWKPFVRKR